MLGERARLMRDTDEKIQDVVINFMILIQDAVKLSRRISPFLPFSSCCDERRMTSSWFFRATAVPESGTGQMQNFVSLSEDGRHGRSLDLLPAQAPLIRAS